jgi:nucleotide-binding universal stress UspA family protein
VECNVFSHILAPVDLEHVDRLSRALQVAADLARHYDIDVTYVAVTSPQPGPVAHNPEEHERKLEAFAADQARAHGHRTHAKLKVSPDPAVELDTKLEDALDEVGADLVVMATHIPGLAEFIWPSHGGKLASHTEASVFLVRPHDE